jgi:hypothetical protein
MLALDPSRCSCSQLVSGEFAGIDHHFTAISSRRPSIDRRCVSHSTGEPLKPHLRANPRGAQSLPNTPPPMCCAGARRDRKGRSGRPKLLSRYLSAKDYK